MGASALDKSEIGKWLIAVLVCLTLPIWLVPVSLFCAVWCAYDCIWGECHPYD